MDVEVLLALPVEVVAGLVVVPDAAVVVPDVTVVAAALVDETEVVVEATVVETPEETLNYLASELKQTMWMLTHVVDPDAAVVPEPEAVPFSSREVLTQLYSQT